MVKKISYFDFEEDLEVIHNKIEELELDTSISDTDRASRLSQLKRSYAKRLSEIYSNLTDWQITQLARHPARPYTLDYIQAIFSDFTELHGDRMFADDASIVAGLAHLGKHAVAVIGHQKGRDTKERTKRNFGMTKPEGFRKALRIMKLAEKFGLPVITFVDTPGAYPGIDAEERNQAEAIGRSIFELTHLKVPVISVIIGEGGSGGALALAVADTVMILQYAVYSVISPEGCASILWKDAGKAPEAAESLSLTATKLFNLGLVDKIISEPLGGAHRDPALMALTLRKALADQLGALLTFSTDDLLARRSTRLSLYGKYLEEKGVISTQVVTNKAPEAPKEEAKSLKEEPVAPKEEKKVKPRKAAAKKAAPKKKASKATQAFAEKSTGKNRTGTRKAKKAEAS
mgnify:FL=1